MFGWRLVLRRHHDLCCCWWVLGCILFCLSFFLFIFVSDVSVEVMSIVSVVGGSRATPRPSGVIAVAIVAVFGVGGMVESAVVLLMKDSLVCFGPVALIFSPLSTFVCLDFMPPLGEASLPVVLVGFRFPLAGLLVIVALVASVRYKHKAESGVQ